MDALRDWRFIGQAQIDQLRGRTVLFATQPQHPTVMRLIELDGIVKRVLLAAGEAAAAFLRRIACEGMTLISGTALHWRLAVMSGAESAIAPRGIRLAGALADHPIRDRLEAVFPEAHNGHAFAPTEVAVALDGRDGLIADGKPRVRSPRAACRYLGATRLARSDDGCIDTGDLVEQMRRRAYFRGRRRGFFHSWRASLARSKVPASLRQAAHRALSPSGEVVRHA